MTNHQKNLSAIQGEWLRSLQLLQEEFEKAGDIERVKRSQSLIKKTKEGEFVIAFCGHFSAGKSTMVNELMGEELLPSSPVPTSANVVKVKTGEPYAKVGFFQSGEKIFPYPYDLAEIQTYCTNGELVDFVEISAKTKNLPEHVAILDTPGIDSVDDAHRVSTESRLYLADLVIYMMDYNHVQSLVNFEFIKNLKKLQKEVFLVINQIDKHLSRELPFSAYKRKVTQAFHEYGIEEMNIYFTTLKEESHPYNELPLLKKALTEKLGHKHSLVLQSIEKESRVLISSHLDWKRDQQKEEVQLLNAVVDSADVNRLLQGQEDLMKKDEWFQERLENFEVIFLSKLHVVLTNAKLIPYDTREYAREFLESQQLSFKLGGLFSGSKTKRVRQERLKRFHESLCANAKVSIDIHLKELLTAYLKEHDVLSDEIRREIHSFAVPITPQFLIDKIKRGAVFSSESARNYCTQIIYDVHQLYVKHSLEIIKKAEDSFRHQVIEQRNKLKEERGSYHRKLEVANRLAAIEKGNLELEQRLKNYFPPENIDLLHATEPVPFAFGNYEKKTRHSKMETVHIGQASRKLINSINVKQKRVNLSEHMKKLTAISKLLSAYPGLQETGESINKKLKKVQDRQFTIALFGAFSAGKSSFANALLGEAMLPVSPNPTTATVNEILPPDEEHKHGMIQVFYKKEAELISDINQALEIAEVQVHTIQELEELIHRYDEWQEKQKEQQIVEDDEKEKEDDSGREEDPPQLKWLGKMELSFLRSVLAGRLFGEGKLGTIQRANYKEFADYVQTEEKACFIEKIRLYYDCPLTQKGMILVDTPGADSINARHTEVAFDYVKSADAVLFVTYYNHAFSRADQEFLIQLGRVKEIFNHDKMFFVVNACDLASSENEIAEVVRHVEKNLLTCGIRNPQIFPISSHIAIMAHKFGKGQLSENEEKRYIKLTNSHAPLKKEDGLEFAGLQVFEEAFYPFILEDLAGVVIHSAQSDAEKSKTMLREWVMLQEKEESEKVKLVKEMEEIQKNALSLLESLEFSMEIDLFKQELNELFYYIQQRVFYRYRDEFRNVFSPHVLKQEDEFASQLLRCTNEVIRFTAKDLAQEVRATSFRMEVYIQKAIQNIYQQLEAQLKELSPGFALRQGEQPKFDKLPIEEGLQEIKASLLKEKFQEYSSGSDFFIERKVFKLRDELEHVLRQPAKDYLLEKEEKMQHEYLPIFEKGLKNAKQDVIHQADSYCRQQIRVLMEKSGPETYRNALNTLKELLAGM